MELRHLRYFVAVAEALNVTRAAARLRVAQPALSRQIQDLEEEIGVDLMKRSPRGVTLTAEGKLFLEEARGILRSTEDSVEKVRALARGEFGELHVGYSPSPTVEILPPALAAFQRLAPRVSVRLHDLAGNELAAGLRSGLLDLAVMQRPQGENAPGIQFEPIVGYPICVAVPPSHPLARKRTVSIGALVSEKVVVFRKSEYADYHHLLDQVFSGLPARPAIAAECDSGSSLITAVESGRGVAVLPSIFARISGRRLAFRPLSPAGSVLEVGISRAVQGDLTPAAEAFCRLVRTERKDVPKR
jgi:DNA-binding transcriptional LysR family regulator